MREPTGFDSTGRAAGANDGCDAWRPNHHFDQVVCFLPKANWRYWRWLSLTSMFCGAGPYMRPKQDPVPSLPGLPALDMPHFEVAVQPFKFLPVGMLFVGEPDELDQFAAHPAMVSDSRCLFGQSFFSPSHCNLELQGQ